MPLRGETIGTAFVRVLLDGDGFKEDLRKSLKESEPDFVKQGEKNAKAFDEGAAKENKKAKKFEKSMDEKMAKIFGSMKKGTERFGEEFQQDFTKKLSKALRGQGENEHDAEELARRINAKMVAAFNSGGNFDIAKQLRPALASARAELDKMSVSERRLAVKMREADEANNSFRRGFLKVRAQAHEGGRDFDTLGDKFGHMFGKGARNDFVNIVGVIVGGMVNIFSKGLGVVGMLGRVGKSLFTASEKGAGFAGMGEKAGAAMAKMVESGPVVVAVLAVVATAVGTATALMSGLAAAVTALASSLAFGLVGAVAPLVGVLLPLGAAIGVSVLAFTNMDKASKKLLKESLKPITTEFKELGKVASKSFTGALTENAGRFHTALAGLKPLVKGVADAMGDVMTNFAKSLNSPAFGKFKSEMGTFLPGAVRMLGNTITNALGGMGGIFRALVPITNEFLHWIQRISGEFSAWANSTAGQAKLKSFFEQAGNSAKAIGRFLKQAGIALGELLSQGSASGDSIFDSMAGALQNFATYLRNNKDAVADFFANGVSIARGLGGVIQGAITLFNNLDNALSRKAASAFITSIIVGFDLINGVFNMARQSLGVFLLGLAKAMQFAGKFSPWGSGWGDDLAKTAHSMMEVSSATQTAAGSASSGQSAYSGLAGTIQQVGTAADQATRSLIEQKLAQDGTASTAASMGISASTLVNATLGQKNAIDKVNTALAAQKGKWGEAYAPGVAAKIAGLGGLFLNAAGKIVQATAKVKGWDAALSGIKSDKIKLAVQTTGFAPAMEQMQNLARRFHLTPKQLKIIASANGFDLTHRRLKILTQDGKDVGKQKPMLKVKADTKDATGKLKAVTDKAKGISTKSSTVKTKADTTSAASKLTALNKKADDTNRKKPSVTVVAHTAAAISDINSVGRAVNNLHDKTITITTRHVSTGKKTASGGIFRSAQSRIIGEAGPEAVVPLARNLNSVDPAVRSLSAFAQGKSEVGTTNNGKVYNFTEGSIQVQSNASDARTVAAEFVNRLVAAGY